MKLKTILYSIAYNLHTLEALKRSQGARRVKQANVMLEERTRLRQAQKALAYPFRYGSSNQALKSYICEGEYDFLVAREKFKDSVDKIVTLTVPKTRQESATHAYKVIYGKGLTE